MPTDNFRALWVQLQLLETAHRRVGFGQEPRWSTANKVLKLRLLELMEAELDSFDQLLT